MTSGIALMIGIIVFKGKGLLDSGLKDEAIVFYSI